MNSGWCCFPPAFLSTAVLHARAIYLFIYFWIQSFVSGGIAGVASRTATSPLDVVKILAQIGTRETRDGFLRSFRNIYRNEGLAGFWKGNTIACLRLFPYNATVFAAFDRLKVWLSDPHTGRLSAGNSLLAGSLAGVVATIATYPLDMVKTRLTADHADFTKAKYRGISHAFRSIYREEGKLAFYKGMSTSILFVILLLALPSAC